MEKFNIWNAENAATSYKQCLQAYHSEKNKAINLCKLGLLEYEVLSTAEKLVLQQLKIGLTLMKQGHFTMVASALASRRRDFSLNGIMMYKSCPPISLFDTIQKIKDCQLNEEEYTEAFFENFGLENRGPALCEHSNSGEKGAKPPCDDQ